MRSMVAEAIETEKTRSGRELSSTAESLLDSLTAESADLQEKIRVGDIATAASISQARTACTTDAAA